MNKTLLGIILLAVVVALPPNALGVDKYFCADTDNTWSGANWQEFAAGEDCTNGTATDPPTAADRAIIVSGKTCNVNVTTAAADRILVESTATLNIEAGKKLTLDGSDVLPSTITGVMNLEGSSSELAIVDNNHTIDGAGKIVGQHNAAKITIAVDRKLTIEGIVEGKLIIEGDGTLKNAGKIHANRSGTLHVNTQFVEDTAGTNRWKVSTLTASILQFDPTDSTRPDLSGDFTVVKGTLDIDGVGFGTTGKLTMKGGTIVFDITGSPDPVTFSDS